MLQIFLKIQMFSSFLSCAITEGNLASHIQALQLKWNI